MSVLGKEDTGQGGTMGREELLAGRILGMEDFKHGGYCIVDG
jgi:hypothetical protein